MVNSKILPHNFTNIFIFYSFVFLDPILVSILCLGSPCFIMWWMEVFATVRSQSDDMYTVCWIYTQFNVLLIYVFWCRLKKERRSLSIGG